MIQSILLFTSFLFLTSASAVTVGEGKWWPKRHESSLCYPKKLDTNRSIVCCDTLRGQNCEATARALLEPQQIQALGDIAEYVMSLPEDRNTAPSCFTTAMVLTGMPLIQPLNMNGAPHLEKELLASYEEVSGTRDLRAGDVLVLDEHGQYLKMEDNEFGHKKYYQKEFPALFNHAMVYLGDGLVIQKENAFTAVSTVSTLSRAVKHYAEGNEITQGVKTMDYARKDTYLVLRVFRKKP